MNGMKLKRLSGIYKITNKVNNKVYIGKASNIYLRYKRHFGDLERGIHHNKYLQRSFNKYGKDTFEFEVIEYSTENLIEKEMSLIQEYDSYKNGYNLTCGGEGTTGLIFSDKHKENLSKAHLGQEAWNKGKTPPANVRIKKMILKDEEIIKKIIERINRGELLKDIAKDFNCHWKTLSRTIKRYNGGFYNEFTRT